MRFGIAYQSYQSGIETGVDAVATLQNVTINRTKVELKLESLVCFCNGQRAINRTKVELKLWIRPLYPIWNDAINRTKVELKHVF